MLLNPEDALLLEALAEFLYPVLTEAQPTKRAYFSRKREGPKAIEDFEANLGYPWWLLWPRFQAEIFEFATDHEFVIVTDLANYYDTIDFSQLRNFLSDRIPDSEPFLDFLFFLLERFVWRPDYLPHPGQGLPQADLDCVRLLAHTFLYELDEFLEQETTGSFVRWMDDVNFGSNSRSEAASILQRLDELLLSRGLRLNAGKTKILSTDEAGRHFQLRENRYLNVLKSRVYRRTQDSRLDVSGDRRRLRKRYRDFHERPEVGHHAKIRKRFLNFAAQLRDPWFETTALRELSDSPDLRETALRYLLTLGWSRRREDKVVQFIGQTLDEVAAFRAVQLLVDWLPCENIVGYVIRMRHLARRLAKDQLVEASRLRLVSAVWLTAKFGAVDDVRLLVEEQQKRWTRHPWTARQVACLAPRCDDPSRQVLSSIVNSFGLQDARRILDNYEHVTSDEIVYYRVAKPFLVALRKDGTIALPKVLIAIAVLKSELKLRVREDALASMLAVVKDPVYRSLLQRSLAAA